MDSETVKKQVWELAEEINELGGLVLEPRQQYGNNANIGLQKTGEQGVLYIKARANGYQVSISEPIREKMYDFMVRLTGKEPDGYNQGGRTKEPRWNISDFQQARKAAYFLADIKQSCSLLELDDEFQAGVLESLRKDPNIRKDQIAKVSKIPTRTQVTVEVFQRNPDVAAEALYRASGVCERCYEFAPFNRKSDGSPYLEVHHIKRLADGGEDTLENVLALCPNCHRELHYGDTSPLL